MEYVLVGFFVVLVAAVVVSAKIHKDATRGGGTDRGEPRKRKN